MNFKKKSTVIWLLTGALTFCVIFGAVFIGVSPVALAVNHTAGTPKEMVGKLLTFEKTDTESEKSKTTTNKTLPLGKAKTEGEKSNATANETLTLGKTDTEDEKSNADADKDLTPEKTGTNSKKYAKQAERYYEAGSLPLFQIIFSRLDEKSQDKWLDIIYTDAAIAFWNIAVGQLDEDCTLIQRYAEKTYENGDIAYFSTLAMYMSEDTLEKWLDKALEDRNWAFQAMLFHALDREEEWEEWEEKQQKEWAEAQAAEYQAAGITMDGTDYYYQGQLVDIFLDIHKTPSCYTLNMNPKGTVNIKVIRNKKNEITDVVYMTETEVMELLGDME